MSETDSESKYLENMRKNWKVANCNFSPDSEYFGLNGCVIAIVELTKNQMKVPKCFE